MATISHVITQQWKNGSNQLTQAYTASGNLEQNVNLAVNTNTQNVQAVVNFNISHLQSIYILTVQNMQIRTNNTAGVQSFDITGGLPFVWVTGCGVSNPFNTDVSALYVDNNTNTSDTMTIRILTNTP